MKILHVITSLQKAAGTSVFCGEVCNGLASTGHDVTIAVVDPNRKDCYPLDRRIRLISISQLLDISQQSQDDNVYDLVHIHAIWSPVLHRVSRWSRRNGIPVVWSPHGMLTPWAFRYKWWKKFPVWWLYQKHDLQQADMIHVTAESECADVRRMGLSNKLLQAPLGVNLPVITAQIGGGVILFVSRIQRKKGLVNLLNAFAELIDMLRIAYIGRVAPIKGLDNLCTACSRIDDTSGWRLRIVGPDQEGHTAELRALAMNLGIERNVEFVGPKYGDELQKEYANGDIFVLPSYSENFGSVVIEALAHGIPVITTKGTPWHELEEHRCGWWVDVGVEPLTKALKEAIAMSDEQRREMGKRGRKLVEEKYTWDVVVGTMMKGYEEVVDGRT